MNKQELSLLIHNCIWSFKNEGSLNKLSKLLVSKNNIDFNFEELIEEYYPAELYDFLFDENEYLFVKDTFESLTFKNINKVFLPIMMRERIYEMRENYSINEWKKII